MPYIKEIDDRVKRGKDTGWIYYLDACAEMEQEPLPDYVDTGYEVDVISDGKIMSYRKKHLKQKPLESRDEEGRKMRSSSNSTTSDMNEIECALDLSQHIHDWDGFYDLEQITQEAWEVLPEKERHPKTYVENAKWSKKVQVPFHRGKLRDYIQQDLANFIVALFFNKAKAYRILKEERFENEVKN